MEDSPSVEQILKIDEPSQVKRRFPFYWIAISLVVFAPLGFVLMWLDSTYHKNFRVWLIIVGLTALISALLGFFSISSLSSSHLFQSQSSNVGFGWSNFVNFLLFCTGIFQLVLAFYFKSENKKIVDASVALLIFASFLILLAALVTIFSAISPIYNFDQTSLQGIS